MFVSNFALLLLAAGALYKLVAYLGLDRTRRGLKELPGPKGYPFVGSALEFPKTFSYHKFTEWASIHGPIYKVNIFGTTHIVLSDLEMANELLTLKGAHFSDRPPLTMHFELITHHGNLGASPVNDYWRNARRFGGKMINPTALETWSALQISEASRLCIDLIADPRQYAYFFERYSTVFMMHMIYDQRVSQSSQDEARHVNTISAINRTLERASAPGTYLVDFLPVLKYLPTFLAPFKAEAKRLFQFEYPYFNGLVKDAEQRYKEESHKSQSPRAWIYYFFDKISDWNLSEFEISYALGTFFEGGSGTTSSAMMSFCLAMWHYPDWQEKIHQEIDTVVGDKRVPQFTDMPNLPLIRACMNETLRWRPVTPGGIPHKCTRDEEFNGYYIPKGAIVHANIYGIFKDDKDFPDPETFNPDRWLNPKFPTSREPLTEYPNLKRFPAFGFGRRICPGLLAAERSLFIEIATLMWACRVSKKIDSSGKVIPVPWYSYQPGNNTAPKPFSFDVELRDQAKMTLMHEQVERKSLA